MATIAKLDIRLGLKTAGMERKLRQTRRQVLGLDRDMRRKLARGVRIGATAMVAGGAAAVTLGKKVLETGAAVEETAAKYRTVFGDAVGRVNKQMETLGRNAGLTTQEFQDVAATSGDIVQGFGATEQGAAEFATTMTRLSADMASFNNIPITQAINAVQSAMVGQTRALKTLGVVVRKADVDQRALLQTGKEQAENLTQLERATATLSLVQERMSKQLGDLNRTQDSTANTARRVMRDFRELRDVAAEVLLPALGSLLGRLDSNSEGFQQLNRDLRDSRLEVQAWVQLVGASLALPVRVVTNAIDIAITSIIGFLGAAASRIGDFVNNLLIRPVNAGIRQINRVLPEAFEIPEAAFVDVEFFGALFSNATRNIEKDARDMVDAIQRVGEAAGNVATGGILLGGQGGRSVPGGRGTGAAGAARVTGGSAGAAGAAAAGGGIGLTSTGLPGGIVSREEQRRLQRRQELLEDNAKFLARLNEEGKRQTPILEGVTQAFSHLGSVANDTVSRVVSLASAIANMVSRIADGAGPGGIIGSVGGVIGTFAGFFQHGGTIPAGQFGVVGERGPEFVSGPASVSPAGFTITVDASSLPAPSTPFEAARDQQWQQLLDESVRVNRQSGGEM